MIKMWNSVVGKNDIVYHLGDFALGLDKCEYLSLMAKLNGQITLIRGNHDRRGVEFLKNVGFKKIHKRSLRLGRYVLTHAPLSINRIPNGCINIHGHIHNKHKQGKRYINVSVEAINYTPIWVNLD